MLTLQADRASERLRFDGEILRLESAFTQERAALSTEIERLHEQLTAERTERQYLNDRLCQKLGLAPIHEPSPGEAALREQAAARGKLLRDGPRAAAIAAGAEAFDKGKTKIKTEVDQFLKENGSTSNPDH